MLFPFPFRTGYVWMDMLGFPAAYCFIQNWMSTWGLGVETLEGQYFGNCNKKDGTNVCNWLAHFRISSIWWIKPLYLVEIIWRKSCLLFPRGIFQVIFHHQMGKTFSVNCGKFTLFLWCFTSYPEDPCMVAIFTYIYHKNEPHVGINIPFFHGSYWIDNLIVQGDAQKTTLKTRGNKLEQFGRGSLTTKWTKFYTTEN